MHFNPRDQIILLAGLLPTAQRKRIWALRDLRPRLAVLRDAGLVDSSGLCDPAGVDAARRIRHITLDDLLAEHLPSAGITTG